MYQDNNQRKWPSPPAQNQPELKTANLKTFLQKRIKAIMAKEWWDFVVNVNTLNSDHASLLYSLANLCPSFNYFLQSRDKELQLIIRKRPVVKPRIFSGTEGLNTTPQPIVPKQLPLVTRRNSANELVRILNELYPNENTPTPKLKQPSLCGPASKKKKMQQMINKKNALIAAENKKNTVSFGRSPLLKRLLADESQKENAHLKKNSEPLSMPILVSHGDEFQNKAVLSSKNFDINQRRFNPGLRKIKKIVKVKKKRYIYSDGLADTKKFILEDETPSLSLKLIKKYRIKKCTVEITRLKDSVLDYYAELRLKNAQENLIVPGEEIQIDAVPANESNTTDLQVGDELNKRNSSTPPVIAEQSDLNSNVDRAVCDQNSVGNVSIVKNVEPTNNAVQVSDAANDVEALNELKNSTTSVAQISHKHNGSGAQMSDKLDVPAVQIKHNGSAAQISDKHNGSAAQISDKHNGSAAQISDKHNGSVAHLLDKQNNANSLPQPTIVSLGHEKDSDVLVKTASQAKPKESAKILERYNSKELKNMYFHGGIVPLGKIAHNDKVNDLKSSKHYVSLKEMKIKEIINDTIECVLNQKKNEDKSVDTIVKSKSGDDKAQVSELPQTNVSADVVSSEPKLINSDINFTNDNCPLNTISSSSDSEDKSESSGALVIHENSSEVSLEELSFLDSSGCSDIIEKNINAIEMSLDTTINNDAPVQNSTGGVEIQNQNSSSIEIPVVNKDELPKDSVCIEKNQKVITSGVKINPSSETFLEETVTESNKSSLKNNLCSTEDESTPPLPKRPRYEVNLTEMKLEVTKTIVKPSSNNDHICKICKLSFNSDESWNDHFENKVPKCTPNLELSWESAELSLLN